MRAWKDKKYILPSLLGRGWGVGLLLLLLLTACHDDDGPDMIGPEAAAWTVDVLGGGAVETDDEGNVYFERTATFGSLRLKIEGYDAQRDSTVKVALAEGGDWLTLETDTLGNEGILSLSTTDNNGDSQRTATLVFTAANGEPPLSATLTVRQHSRADADSNGGNAKEDLYVGYGYDIFKALDSPMSVRTKTPIIDLDKLRAAGSAAANSLETSKADVFDQQMGVFLSNAFARTFRSIINDNPAVPIYDLYRQLSRTTNGSHVTLYNENQYGSVYTSTMDDFFPE